jgi:amino acid transporter
MSTQVGGEIKRATSPKWQVGSTVIPVIVTMGLGLVLSYLLLQVIGSQFLFANGFLFSSGNALLTKLPFEPNFYFLPVLAFPNPITIVILMLAIHFQTLFYDFGMILPASRYLFAYSFDRIFPAKFGYVSGRFHVPIAGGLLCGVVAAVWLAVATLQPSVWLFFSAASIAVYVVIEGMLLAAVVFPYRAKEWYNSTYLAKYKVGSVPLITIVGILGLIGNSYLIVMYVWPLASLGWGAWPISAVIMPIMYVFFGALYYVAKWYRKKYQGFDLGLAFKQLPPE